jgi:hypothetical protein
MTEQEAIEILQNTILKVGMTNCKTIFGEAYAVAIKALRNEARRKELIEYYTEEMKVEKFATYKDLLEIRIKHLKQCEVKG